MDYRTGTYLITAKKTWPCQSCGKPIIFGTQHFARVTEGQERTRSDGEKYTEKTYQRYHSSCALALNNLSDYEKQLLGPVLLALGKSPEPSGDTISHQNAAECA